METKATPKAASVLDDYFKNYAPELDLSQRVRVTAAALELLRMASGLAVVGRGNPFAARLGLVELLAQLIECDWERVPFSITHAALKNPGAAIDIFAGLKGFATLVEIDPASANREVFDALMEPPAEPEPEPAPPPPAPRKKGPELAHDGNLAKVFKPVKFSPEGNPPAQLLSYQSTLRTGEFGPQLPALCVEHTETELTLLLSTGEFYKVPAETFMVAKTDDPADYASVPLHLMACARAFPDWRWPDADKLSDAQLDARFGKFTQPLHWCPYSSALIAPLMQVFDFPDASPEGHAVSVRLSVDGTPYFVTLEARVAKDGPYVTAKLFDASDNLVMRLDTPRMFSPLGVYLFPLKESAIALVVH